MRLKQVFAGVFTFTMITMGTWMMVIHKAASAQEVPDSAATVATNLTGTSWKLVSWGTPENLSEPIGGRTITAQFYEKENIVRGSSGCNLYGDTYQIGDNMSLIINDDGDRTEARCPTEEISNQEKRYFNALHGAKSYQITETGLLEISYETDTAIGVLIFEPQ